MTATSSNLRGAAVPQAQDIGACPLNEAIDLVVGTTATILARPSGKKFLVLGCTAGTFKLKPGKYDGQSPNPAFPTAAATTTGATAGTAAWALAAGKEMKIPAPDFLTVQGASGTDVLQYYWI